MAKCEMGETAVPGGQSFGYDASGQRVKTVQPNGRIRYTPFPTYEEEVWPVAATTPIVTLTANGQTAVTIPPNTAFTLQWQASNAFACEAGGSWSGSKPLNGSQNFKGFNSGSRTYSLTCSNISGSTSRSVTVQIGYGFDLPLAVVIVPLDGPTSGQTTIQRSTYSLAGQAIATRVNGDPEGHDGLYYLYSDHASALLSTGLGSASALVTSGGQKVNETRYLPFGGYRSGGPNAITDRGFTGHKENMTDLGLIYMNARYYAPNTNRFLSADTIVPDAKDPQSLNRYAYVRNNPLKYVDETGHCWGFASGLRNTFYATTCNNLDMAVSIVQSPDASVGQKVQAGAYIAVEAAAHGMLAAGSAILAGEAVAAAAPYASSAIAAAETTALAHPTASAMVGGAVETAVECSMTGGGCGVADYAVGAVTAGVAHRLSNPGGIRGAAPGMGDEGGPNAGHSITPSQRVADLQANVDANSSGHYWCTHCGYENSNSQHFDIDHIIPRSQGGNNNPNNRRVLCIGCNRSAQEGWPPKMGSDWSTKHSDWDMRE